MGQTLRRRLRGPTGAADAPNKAEKRATAWLGAESPGALRGEPRRPSANASKGVMIRLLRRPLPSKGHLASLLKVDVASFTFGFNAGKNIPGLKKVCEVSRLAAFFGSQRADEPTAAS